MYIQNVSDVFSKYNPLISFLEELINFGYKDIFSCPQHYKDESIALVMDALGDDQLYIVLDCDEFSKYCDHLKDFIRNQNLNSSYKFSKSIKISAFNRYKDQINLIMNYIIEQRRAA
jgi:hypothetical protein